MHISIKTLKKSITIVGDSVVKDIKSFKLRKSLENKSFPGATTEDMDYYIKPSLKGETP